jgi:Kef-type K+ transport system membrane component KefB
MFLIDTTGLGAVATLLLVLVAAIVVFIGAVWFGLRVIAPRLGRAVDRAEEDDHERD